MLIVFGKVWLRKGIGAEVIVDLKTNTRLSGHQNEAMSFAS